MAIAFFKFASALFTRILFFVHGFVSVYLVWESKARDPKYWWLSTGLVLMLFESIYTIIIRKGKEYKYFWPGSLLYMCTVLPAIWVAEMSILQEKQKDPEKCLSSASTAVYSTLSGGITIRADRDTLAQKWSKLGLILVIIIGRWLLPRGELTRDQLSNLLLVYVANAADIMELFELFDDQPKLWCITGVAESILVTYSWSFMQFTLVFTATAKSVPDEAKKQIANMTENDKSEGKRFNRDKRMPKYIRKLINQKRQENVEKINKLYGDPTQSPRKEATLSGYTRRKRERYSIRATVKEVVQVQREIKLEEDIIEEVIKEKEKLRLHGDLYSILTIMFMQDGPFLIVRLVMLIKYNVTNEMHLFFTGKNAMALALLLYRMLVLLFEGKDEEEGEEDDRESANSRSRLDTSQV